MSETTRVLIKRPAKKKVGFEVEKRKDGYYYVTAVPSKKSSIQPGDRVLEINGVPYTDFKDTKMANELFEKLVLEIIPADNEDDDEQEDEDSDDDLD